MAKLDVTDSIRHFPNIISREFFNWARKFLFWSSLMNDTSTHQ